MSPRGRISPRAHRFSRSRYSRRARRSRNKTRPGSASRDLNRHGGRLASADAQARDAALASGLLERADQGDEDTRARGADRVAERTGTAVNVDPLVRQAVLSHRRHGDYREGLVDLVEIDFAGAPAGRIEFYFYGAH